MAKQHVNRIKDTFNIKDLCKKLKKDPSLYYAYQANIAVQFQDECAALKKKKKYLNRVDIHEASNKAAKNFLNLLISLK